VRLDLPRKLVRGLGAGGEAHERLDDVAAQLVGRGDGGRLDDLGVLDDRRLDLERADPVAGRDDDVVVSPLVPAVAVLVAAKKP